MSDQRRGFDHRNYVSFDNTMPENAKILELSDAAFRTLFNLICYCNRQENDGKLTEAALRAKCRPKVRDELEANGNLERIDEGRNTWQVHDYLMHNRSHEEMEYLRGAKSDSGSRGSHARWHVGRRRFEPTCAQCVQESSGVRLA